MNTLNVIAEFRNDHRKVRDSLLAITEAIGKKDLKKARDILGELNKLVGPHFMYEEEYLYPALRKFLGNYVSQLLSEHDGVIETAKKCTSLLQKESLTEKEAEDANKAAMAILIHVSNCDGLAILTERFTSEELEELGHKLEESRKAGIPLLELADTIRK